MANVYESSADSFMDKSAVLTATGYSPTGLHYARVDGRFPEPFAVFGGTPVWKREDVLKFIDDRANASGNRSRRTRRQAEAILEAVGK